MCLNCGIKVGGREAVGIPGASPLSGLAPVRHLGTSPKLFKQTEPPLSSLRIAPAVELGMAAATPDEAEERFYDMLDQPAMAA